MLREDQLKLQIKIFFLAKFPHVSKKRITLDRCRFVSIVCLILIKNIGLKHKYVKHLAAVAMANCNANCHCNFGRMFNKLIYILIEEYRCAHF